MAFLIFLLLSTGALGADWDARIMAVKGSVNVVPAGTQKAVAARAGFPLSAGDSIKTGFASRCEIAFEGGRVIQLRDHGEFTLKSLDRGSAEVWLSLGSFLARIKTLSEGQNLYVRTAAAVCAVRGTKFAVEIPSEDHRKAFVGVFDEGKIEVSGSQGGPVAVDKNSEVSVSAGAAPGKPSRLKRFARLVDSMAEVTSRAEYLESHWEPATAEQRAARRREALSRAGVDEIRQMHRTKER